MTSLTKTEQWTSAATMMKYLALAYSKLSVERRDEMAVEYLQNEHPTSPWEYPWSEVVRSQRKRRRT